MFTDPCRNILFIFFLLSYTNGFLMPAERCTGDQFQCDNKKCTPKLWHCDGTDDCQDGSDEKYCDFGNCPPNAYHCKSGNKCIRRDWLCDGSTDCFDGDDEDEAICFKRKCTKEEFACRFKIGKCVPLKALCDGHSDCEDYSDEAEEVCKEVLNEKHPNATCLSDEFQCTDGLCINNLFKCDGKADCADGADEQGCENVAIECSEDQFRCTTGRKCIPKAQRCNANFDCADHSDEEGCPAKKNTTVNPCPFKGDFYCGPGDPGHCIPPSFVCDLSADCHNGLDEINCPSKTCKDYEFKCHSMEMCLSNIVVCDGVNHCPDGSDEENCPSRESKSKCNESTEFDCAGNGKNCIPLNLMCNGKNDCGMFEDERPGDNPQNCMENPCSVSNGACAHHCINKYISRVCSCRPGYRLMSDKRTCEDVNECERDGACSHTCINTKGSFKCTCMQGYSPNFTDPTRCVATGEKFLLYATGDSIREIRMLHNDMRPIVKDLSMAVALDYDYTSEPQVLFWSQLGEGETMGKIGMTTLGGSRDKAPIQYIDEAEVSVPDGLAFDWVHKMLFWTDTGMDTKRICVMNVTNREWTVLVDTDLDEPRAIVVDPRHARVYWNDWGAKPKISMIGMNGQDREVLVDTDIGKPNGLALDYVHNRLYWGDYETGAIAWIDLKTRHRKIVLQSKVFYPFSLALFEDFVYWSDWRAKKIFAANKFTGKNIRTIAGSSAPMGIRMFHQFQQVKGYNFCVGNACSHLCLPAPQLGLSRGHQYSCDCPMGMRLKTDSVTCEHVGNSTTRFKPRSPTPILKSAKELAPTANTVGGTAPVSQHKVGLVAGAVIGGILGLTLVGAIVGFLIYRNYVRRALPGVNFDNPVYKRTTDMMVMDTGTLVSEENGFMTPSSGASNGYNRMANVLEPLTCTNDVSADDERGSRC